MGQALKGVSAVAPGGRRLLLISYHFPPGQAVGALRWQKLAGFAAERGWGLDVVTQDPSSLPDADWTRMAELPPETRVYGVPACRHPAERLERLVWQTYRRLRPHASRGAGLPRDGASSGDDAWAHAGLVPRAQLRWRVTAPRDYVRAFEAWLDFAHAGTWSRAAGVTALRLVQPGVHRAIVTSGPPHMVHLAGRLVSRRTGLPHVMDMRDPWSLNPALPVSQASPLWLWLAARYERSAVERAALVVTNTEPFRVAMQALYPSLSSRIIAVMNGCEDEPIASAPAARRFIIAYAGSIYIDRDPRTVFRAAGRVVRELRLAPDRLGIEFMGHADSFGGVSIGTIAREEGLEGYVSTLPPGPRVEAMKFLAQATMLVSLPQDTPLAIPSKVFEYMQFNAWLLVLAKHDSATARLLRDTTADVVEPDDLDGIVAVLRTRYLKFAAGDRPTRIASNGVFSRREQAQVLFDAVERCTGGVPCPDTR